MGTVGRCHVAPRWQPLSEPGGCSGDMAGAKVHSSGFVLGSCRGLLPSCFWDFLERFGRESGAQLAGEPGPQLPHPTRLSGLLSVMSLMGLVIDIGGDKGM